MKQSSVSMYDGHDIVVSPEGTSWSVMYTGIPVSPSVYARLRSWLLQEPDNLPPDLSYGSPLIRKVENVRMLDRYNTRKPSVGTLYLTTTHLIFVDPDGKKETWILLMHIANVEKLPLTTTGSPLQIRCKTFLSVTFVLPRERDCHEVFTTLQQLAQPASIEDLYCFHYTSSTEDIPKPAGWNFFDLQSEFQRMRVPNDQWSLTLLNKDYELCDTYPRYLYVPSSASTTTLVGSSRFRSKGRLPVLAYLHRNKAVICRCSQPLSGFSARCLEDEQLLNCILRTNPNSSYMYVVDTRPRINAMANRAAGKGYENANFYDNIKFHFLGIDNIHVMRSSLAKLIETCELKAPSMSSFLNGIESSGWLRHIRSILETSWFIAQALEKGVSVVVHCSDGWDRTAQVCSVAGLFLDPYYRTIQGFQALIEKDWLAFGHKFSERCGHVAGDPKEVSPVFTQLVDCAWQLTQQFPTTFQFNERFLLTLHDHVQSCQFGTFIGNCEKDRVDLKLTDRTFSLWGYMANHMNEYINPLYNAETTPDILIPNISPQNIRFWRGMYCRFENGVHPREPLGDLLLATCDHSSSLEDHIRLLTKRITILKEQLAESGDKRRSITGDSLEMDNKYLYEKGGGEDVDIKLNLATNNGVCVPPVKPKTIEILSVDQLTNELDSVALDWKTLRNIRECVCSTPFDHFSRKYHCWKCGEVFCTRCIDKHTPLPGHMSQRAVPVCKPCYREIRRSSSVESP
ncbi:myotubularin-related protein 8 isoform X1 [Anabrus simplex]|uniref:myotubularin-related protein 8 isoform X1 n=2 Tax=Anabrus simplex TaxID=316456 RepID=UPI0034DCC6CD